MMSAVKAATSLCDAIVEWMMSQLSATAPIDDAAATPRSSDADADDVPVGQQQLNTLEMAQDMLMIAMSEWPVSEHLHENRVRT